LKLLIVDDHGLVREGLKAILGQSDLKAECLEAWDEVSIWHQITQHADIDLVLLDIWMPDTDGVTLLKEWSTGGLLNMPVIMMSGHATIDTAVDAIRIGAQAFLEKPITLQKLLKTVEQGLAREQVRQAAAAYQASQLPAGNAAPAPLGVASSQDLVPQVSQTFDLDLPLRDARDAFEKAYFEFHLANEGGSMTRVADKTGLERTHLYRKLKQLGVDLTKGKRAGA
jgi:DNA-binding NtrC family response regulator